MTIQEFRNYMASGKPIEGGSDVHMMFHRLSQEALRITAEINGKYHTPEELHKLLEQLWGREVPKLVGLFPPFHTDCGKNTVVGERVFINMGRKFQDQGGITIDEGALIGHNVVLATLNHLLDPERRAVYLCCYKRLFYAGSKLLPARYDCRHITYVDIKAGSRSLSHC